MSPTVVHLRALPQRQAQGRGLSRVAWLHPENVEFAEWVAFGRRFGAIGRGCQWWIGDWLLYGTARFGERYAEASKITGYDPKSLRNMRYVASRFDPSLRRDNLNWSHHALLAGLERSEQAYWLDRAATDRLSVDDLRCELRAAQRGAHAVATSSSSSFLPLALAPAPALVCPNCGSQIRLSKTALGAVEASSETT